MILIQIIMRKLTTLLRVSFAKAPQPYEIGLMGEQPDIKGRDLDKFRRWFTRAHFHHAGKEMPNFQQQRHDESTIERNQIETRILRVIRDLQILNVSEMKFQADLRRDLKIDSLNVVALLTSIEHEFTTVFEDNVFEGLKTLDEVVTILARDPKII